MAIGLLPQAASLKFRTCYCCPAKAVWPFRPGPRNAPRLRRAFLTIINRPPTATEQQHLLEALVNFERQYEKEKVGGHKHKALADICHALFNSASFLYID